MIALFGETSGYLALQCMRERMLRDETGSEILRWVEGGEGMGGGRGSGWMGRGWREGCIRCEGSEVVGCWMLCSVRQRMHAQR